MSTIDYFDKATDALVELLDDNKSSLGIKNVRFGKRTSMTEYTVCVEAVSERIDEDGIPIGFKQLNFSWVIWINTTKIDVETGDKELLNITKEIRALLSQNRNLVSDETDPARLWDSKTTNRDFGRMSVGNNWFRTARIFYTGYKRTNIIET